MGDWWWNQVNWFKTSAHIWQMIGETWHFVITARCTFIGRDWKHEVRLWKARLWNLHVYLTKIHVALVGDTVTTKPASYHWYYVHAQSTAYLCSDVFHWPEASLESTLRIVVPAIVSLYTLALFSPIKLLTIRCMDWLFLLNTSAH